MDKRYTTKAARERIVILFQEGYSRREIAARVNKSMCLAVSSGKFVPPSDRIAQLICQKILYPEIIEIKQEDQLTTTERGEEGVGSSDK
ncbi:dUTPase [Popillia japonica]|uniref:dUTPase n=1 Tax=Popillia japonica TaxID=7064 RepID=A0AAW1LX73_POPJA